MTNIDKKRYRIALDVMGGDYAPVNEIDGALSALKNKPADIELEIIFVGDEKQIKSVLAEKNAEGLCYSIIDAQDAITMNDDPMAAIKTKKNSSLSLGLRLQPDNKAEAFVSAGNTGAVLSAATLILGRIKGVSRPTIGTFMPTVNDRPALLLDVGATVDSRSRFLYEYAIMGSIYYNQMMGVDNPKIGLLSVGEEKSKGTEVVRETHQMLSESNLNFIGNVEGRDILRGTADVTVCDGFVGNIVLKLAESFVGLLKSKIKQFSDKNIFKKMQVALMVPVLRKILKEFDYEEHGGVPLLGVNGVVIIGHGKSSPKAVKNMILRAVEIIRKDVNKQIEIALNPKNI